MNRSLYLYWHQGFAHAPKIVQLCASRWESMNPGWTVLRLDQHSLKDVLDTGYHLAPFRGKQISLPHLADIIRLALIVTRGGVWADGTTYCNVPLDDWLPAAESGGFFAFSNDEFVRQPRQMQRPISNWFLYSEKGHPVSSIWLTAIREYWQRRQKIEGYFRHHRLFSVCHERNETFRSAWSQTLKMSFGPPHYFWPWKQTLPSPLTEGVKEYIDSSTAPVYKLTRHGMGPFASQMTDASTVIGYLFSRPIPK